MLHHIFALNVSIPWYNPYIFLLVFSRRNVTILPSITCFDHVAVALIPILCWSFEHVAKFLRRNFSRSTLYRWVTSQNNGFHAIFVRGHLFWYASIYTHSFFFVAWIGSTWKSPVFGWSQTILLWIYWHHMLRLDLDSCWSSRCSR